MDDDIPYLLLTPGPLTTSRTVRQAMLQDWCTWDDEYNGLVQELRERLVHLATPGDAFTAVPMQGSGTFAVESALGTLLPQAGRLLVLSNGAYGRRMAQIAARLRISHVELAHPETEALDLALVNDALSQDPDIGHVAVVHCETTTGMLNDVAAVGRIVKRHGRVFIVDAMSSFGGLPFSAEDLCADALVSSANKCIAGVPGFGFVIVRRALLAGCAGRARSLSLDLYDQWQTMEREAGKWRFTSPTHTVRAFLQALRELEDEGGVSVRHARYVENQRRLVTGLSRLGFRTLLPAALQSPFITSFHLPDDPGFRFSALYQALKRRRFVIYPGKVSDAETFRVGSIGHVFPEDIDLLVRAFEESVAELGIRLGRPTPSEAI
jgi:2-aminoethylphosphonate-pyruvate transaminase